MVVPSRKRLRRKNAPLSSSELGTQREGLRPWIQRGEKKEANPVTKEKRTMTAAHVFLHECVEEKKLQMRSSYFSSGFVEDKVCTRDLFFFPKRLLKGKLSRGFPVRRILVATMTSRILFLPLAAVCESLQGRCRNRTFSSQRTRTSLLRPDSKFSLKGTVDPIQRPTARALTSQARTTAHCIKASFRFCVRTESLGAGFHFLFLGK